MNQTIFRHRFFQVLIIASLLLAISADLFGQDARKTVIDRKQLREAEKYFDIGLKCTGFKPLDLDCVIRNFSAALELNPQWSEAHVNLGYGLYQRDDRATVPFTDKRDKLAAAFAEFDRAIEVDATDWGIYLYRGSIFLKEGDYNEALADYNRAIDFLESYGTKEELRFNQSGNYLGRAVTYLKLGKSNLAMEDFARAVELKGEFYSYDNQQRYDVQSIIFEAVFVELDKILKDHPDFEFGFYARGIAHFYWRQYDAAVKDFDKAIEVNAAFSQAYAARAHSRNRLPKPDYGQMLDDYNKAIELNPKDYRNYVLRCRLYKAMGDKENAEADRKILLKFGKKP